MTQICVVTPAVRKAISLGTVLKFGDRDDETEVGKSMLKFFYNLIIFLSIIMIIFKYLIKSTFRYLSHNLISYSWLKFYVAIDNLFIRYFIFP